MAKYIPEKPGMHRDANPELFKFARSNRLYPTEAEALLWEALRDKKNGNFKFRRQHPIGPYILDFYCHASKLAIEIDGGYHNSKDQADYDKNRTVYLEQQGLKVIRFSNDQIVNNLDVVLEEIQHHLSIQDVDVRSHTTGGEPSPDPTPDP